MGHIFRFVAWGAFLVAFLLMYSSVYATLAKAADAADRGGIILDSDVSDDLAADGTLVNCAVMAMCPNHVASHCMNVVLMTPECVHPQDMVESERLTILLDSTETLAAPPGLFRPPIA